MFSFPDDFKDHKEYVKLLKKALLVVKPGAEKKFLYFKQYPFGAKKLQLVLVDFDPTCATALTKAGHKTTAEGIVTLTENEELNFDAKKGSLKRIKIKRYFGTLGPGIKQVFVPPGEVDDDEGGDNSGEGEALATPTHSTLPSATGPSPSAPPHPNAPAQPVPPPPLGKQVEPKLEFEENEFKRRQLFARVEELRKKPFPPLLDRLKAQTLEKSKALGQENKFAEATQLLDLLAAKATSAQTQPAFTPKLSTYMNASRDWRAAKKTAGDGVFALKNAIFKECDKELEKAVKGRIDQLNGILAVMDDGILTKIEDAGRESDPERQVERNQELAKFANNVLAAVRNHPLANVADSNPFGIFTIRGPVETVLTKFVADFGT